MNERILELYKQAHVPSTAIDPSNNMHYQTTSFSAEKFAELIVKQCGYYADIFDGLGCPVDMDPTETKPSDYIKNHFGVK